MREIYIKEFTLVLRIVSLSPLIGVFPLYLLWTCETLDVIFTTLPEGISVGYSDPKVYALYSPVSFCLLLGGFMLIPSLLAFLIGLIRVFVYKAHRKTTELSFYLFPFLVYLIIIANFNHQEIYLDPLGALRWFFD